TPDWEVPEKLGGAPVTARAFCGYLGMMAEPQYTVVPQAALHDIVAWLTSSRPGAGTPVDPGALDRLVRPRATWPLHGLEIAEEMVAGPVSAHLRLAGVLTAPVAGPARRAVVLANSGSVHHVGPNRFYVELARALAEDGVATLRLDLRNL